MRGSSDGSSISISTLAITAVASAVAAYTCSKLWAPGTLASAAFMPVAVAIVKELLERPKRVVTRAVPPVRGIVRHAPRTAVETGAAAGRVPQAGEIQYHASDRARYRGLKIALVTGLLGFVIAACIITAPELLAGRSSLGDGRSTTLFGGDSERDRTQTGPTQTTTKTVTAPPARTVTVPAPAQTTTAPAPTVTVPPTTTVPTTTAPTTTTPVVPGGVP